MVSFTGLKEFRAMITLLAPFPLLDLSQPAAGKSTQHRQLIGAVFRQWLARPADQKNLSPVYLDAFLRDRSNRSGDPTFESSQIMAGCSR